MVSVSAGASAQHEFVPSLWKSHCGTLAQNPAYQTPRAVGKRPALSDNDHIADSSKTSSRMLAKLQTSNFKKT